MMKMVNCNKTFVLVMIKVTYKIKYYKPISSHRMST